MYDEILMVEFDLPWVRNVVDSPGFPEPIAEAVAEAKGRGRRVNVLAFAPHSRHSRPGKIRLMYFWRAGAGAALDALEAEGAGATPEDDDGATRVGDFSVAEYVVPADDVAAATRFLLFAEGDARRFAAHKVDRDGGAAGDGTRDLFVCTHGARDACCGRFGAALQIELDALAAARSNVRVWRSSHLGGHRFAPTLLELPTGRFWGAVDSAALQPLVEGSAHPDGLRRYLRGWTGLQSAEEQVAEGEAWRRIGSDWMRYDKWVWTVAEHSDPDSGEKWTTVAVAWTDPDTGKQGRLEMDVAVTDVITLSESCGSAPIQSPQWTVVRCDEA